MHIRNFYFIGGPDDGQSEDDLTGKEYQLFLNICFQYCASVSFILTQGIHAAFGDAIIPAELEKYRIPTTRKVQATHGMHSEAHHFRLCKESQEIIRKMSPSLYSWTCDEFYRNPEDLTFFREDETVFFESVTHEGEFYLRARDDEDVSALVSDPRWVDLGDKKWYYIFPENPLA